MKILGSLGIRGVFYKARLKLRCDFTSLHNKPQQLFHVELPASIVANALHNNGVKLTIPRQLFVLG